MKPFTSTRSSHDGIGRPLLLPPTSACLLLTVYVLANIFSASSSLSAYAYTCNNPSNFNNNGFRRPSRFATSTNRRRRLDRAFDKLEEELRERRQKEEEYFLRQGRINGEDNMMLNKQKEWINKAFDFAKDLNQDFSPSETDMKQNEKDLEQIRDWINRIYEVGFDRSKNPSSYSGSEQPPEADGISETENPISEEVTGNDDDTAEVDVVELGMMDQADDGESSTSIPKTPYYEIRSIETLFQVAVDVPGMDRSDIDIVLKDKDQLLTISYERNNGMKFAKTFNLDDSVVAGSISAELKNGVLMVSAPKKEKKKEEDLVRKIPIL